MSHFKTLYFGHWPRRASQPPPRIDLAPTLFARAQAHGQVVIRRQLKRRYLLTFFQKLPPCSVGIEACAFGRRVEPRAIGCLMRAAMTGSRTASVLTNGRAP